MLKLHKPAMKKNTYEVLQMQGQSGIQDTRNKQGRVQGSRRRFSAGQRIKNLFPATDRKIGKMLL